MALLPERSIHERRVKSAVKTFSEKGAHPRPFIRVVFEEDGLVMYLGPLDYYRAARDAQVVGTDVGNRFDLSDPHGFWNELPADPSFLVGRKIEFRVEYRQHDGRTFQAFRFRKAVH